MEKNVAYNPLYKDEALIQERKQMSPLGSASLEAENKNSPLQGNGLHKVGISSEHRSLSPLGSYKSIPNNLNKKISS
ncbi:MAG: hypothetical protein EBX41_01375 [Chitinophagia bacterium]|nr:hypothetical protein [Chitinophagia bacterium]